MGLPAAAGLLLLALSQSAIAQSVGSYRSSDSASEYNSQGLFGAAAQLVAPPSLVVINTASLINAVANAASQPSVSIQLVAGNFALAQPLQITTSIALMGAGPEQTTISCSGGVRKALDAHLAAGQTMLVTNVSFVGCEESAVNISATAGSSSDSAPAAVQVTSCSFLSFGSGPAVSATGAVSLLITDSLFQSTPTGSRPQLDLGGDPRVVSTQQSGAAIETAPSGGALGGIKQSAAVVASGISSLTLVRTRVTASVRAVLATSVPIVQINSSIISNNVAVGQGGAVAVLDSSTQVLFFNTTLSSNLLLPGPAHAASTLVPAKAGQDGGTPQVAMGGAVYVESPAAAFVMLQCFVAGNQASGPLPPDQQPVAGNGGGIFVQAQTVFIQRTNFTANVALGNYSTGGGGNVTAAGLFRLYGSNFTSNAAGRIGGGLAASTLATLDVQLCNFMNNTAGSIMRSSQLRPLLNNISLSSGIIAYGGGMTAVGTGGTQGTFMSVRGTTFTNNSATLYGGGLYTRAWADQSVFNTAFTTNYAGVHGGGLYWAGNSGYALTQRCTFSGNAAGEYGDPVGDNTVGYGGGMASWDEGMVEVDVDSCTFTNNVAGYSGGALSFLKVEQSNISSCTFTNNVATAAGGAIEAYTVPDMSLWRSTFLNNSAGGLGPGWTFNNPSFGSNGGVLDEGKSYGGAVYAPSSWLLITAGTTFTANQAALGGALYGDRMNALLVDGASQPHDQPIVFHNNLAAVGGAMFIADGSPAMLTGPGIWFDNNTAASGGALTLYASYSQMLRLDLTSNSALLDTSLLTPVHTAWASNLGCGLGGGGAICIKGFQPQLTTELIESHLTNNVAVSGGAVFNGGLGDCDPSHDCFYLIVLNTTMDGNRAIGGGGGGLYWTYSNSTAIVCEADTQPGDVQYLLAQQQYSRRDWALEHGPQLEACPEWQGNVAMGDAYGPSVASSPFSLSASPLIPYYSSNSDLPITVEVHDYYGQLASGTSTALNDVYVTAVSPLISGQTQLESRNGSASFEALKLRAPAGLHPLVFNATTPIRNLAPALTVVEVRSCMVGEFLVPTGDQCMPCDAGTFNTDPLATSCQPCPDSSDCSSPQLGGGIIVPQDGFWHSNPFSEDVLECPNKVACTFHNRSLLVANLQSWLLDGAAALRRTAAEEAAARALAVVQRSGSLVSIADLYAALAAGNTSAGNSTAVPDGPQAALAAFELAKANLSLWGDLLVSRADLLSEVNITDALELYEDALCAEGYAGNVCAECAPGWGETESGKCKPCPPWAINTTFYALITLITVVGLLMTLRLSMRRMSFARVRDAGSLRNTYDGSEPLGQGALDTLESGPHSSISPSSSASYQASFFGAGPSYQTSGPPAASFRPIGSVIWEGPEREGPSEPGHMGGGGHAIPHGGDLSRSMQSVVPAPPHGPSAPDAAPPPPSRGPWPGRHMGLHGPDHDLVTEEVEGYDTGALMSGAHGRRTTSEGGYASRPSAHPHDPLSQSDLMLPQPPMGPSMGSGSHGWADPNSSAPAGAALSQQQQLRRRSRASHAGYHSSKPGSASSSVAGAAPAAGTSSTIAGQYSGGGSAASRGNSAGGTTGSGSAGGSSGSNRAAGLPPLIRTSASGMAGAGAGYAARSAQQYTPHHGQPEDRDSAQAREGHVGHAAAFRSEMQPRSYAEHGGDGMSHSFQDGECEMGKQGTAAGGSARASEFDPLRENHSLADPTTLKIFVSYLQVLGMVRNVPLDFPNAFGSYMRVYSTITSIPGASVSVDCSLPDYGPNMSKAMIKVIVAVASPIYTSLAITLLWVGYYQYLAAKAVRQGRSILKEVGPFSTFVRNRLTVTWLTAAFFFYPAVVSALLSIFACTDLDSGPNNSLARAAGLRSGSYWEEDFAQKCYTGPHLVLTLIVGVPGLILFAAGLPIASAWFLYRRRTALERPKFLALYSFLYEEYRPQYFMWESVIMLRKLGVAAITVFMAREDLGVQMLVVMAVIMLALALQTMLGPFKNKSMNMLEKLALWTIMATLYLSLFLVYSDLDINARMVLSVLLILLNSVNMLVFSYFIVIEYYDDTKIKLGIAFIPEHLPPVERRKEVQRILTQRWGRMSKVLTPVVLQAQEVEAFAKSARVSGARTLLRMGTSMRAMRRRMSSSGLAGNPDWAASDALQRGNSGGSGSSATTASNAPPVRRALPGGGFAPARERMSSAAAAAAIAAIDDEDHPHQQRDGDRASGGSSHLNSNRSTPNATVQHQRVSAGRLAMQHSAVQGEGNASWNSAAGVFPGAGNANVAAVTSMITPGTTVVPSVVPLSRDPLVPPMYHSADGTGRGSAGAPGGRAAAGSGHVQMQQLNMQNLPPLRAGPPQPTAAGLLHGPGQSQTPGQTSGQSGVSSPRSAGVGLGHAWAAATGALGRMSAGSRLMGPHAHGSPSHHHTSVTTGAVAVTQPTPWTIQPPGAPIPFNAGAVGSSGSGALTHHHHHPPQHHLPPVILSTTGQQQHPPGSTFASGGTAGGSTAGLPHKGGPGSRGGSSSGDGK